MKYYLWHRFIFVILRYTAGPIIRAVMRYRVKKLDGPGSPSLVIANHNTDLDPALVAMGFSRHMYFVASEHAFRKGVKSKILRAVFEPIPINKTRADIGAIREVLRRLKAGANVCLFAEGDRAYNGMTGPISISTAKMVKASGADLVTFRLEGGYFTMPRWAKHLRSGKMAGNMVNRYPAAEMKTMSDEQILDLIRQDIFEDAYEQQKVTPIRYQGSRLAEGIELALYLCPGCHSIGTLRSDGDRFYCGCGLEATYDATGFLKGEGVPFSTITEWDKWQAKELEGIIKNAGNDPICKDEGQKLFLVHAASGIERKGEGPMYIDREAFHCAGNTFPLREIVRFTIVGRMNLVFSLKNGAMYEVSSDTPRSALKYREIFRILNKASLGA